LPSHLVPVRRLRDWATLGAPTAIAFALVLFVGVFALREGDPNVGDGEGTLYVVPIAMLALRFGLRGGLTGTVLSFALLAIWGLSRHTLDVTPVGYLTRGTAFLVLGVLLGAVVDERRRLAAEISTWLEAKVVERTHEMHEARAETLHRLAIAADYHDDETAEHTRRVGVSAAEIAVSLGLDADQVSLMGEAAPLHDVGKLAITDRILLKSGRLTTPEYDVMKTHAAFGARVLSGSHAPVIVMAAMIAASHHENWDGTGYPLGLAGEAIPLVGRIVAVADVFDALMNDRPYKAAWSLEESLAEIRRCAGSKFDPRIVTAFLAAHRETMDPSAVPNQRDREQVIDTKPRSRLERSRSSVTNRP
jgi:HD-GYP domain-containing protein (c-di-GMP phosphodiesterase class II)